VRHPEGTDRSFQTTVFASSWSRDTELITVAFWRKRDASPTILRRASCVPLGALIFPRRDGVVSRSAALDQIATATAEDVALVCRAAVGSTKVVSLSKTLDLAQ
jgi:hypothetical protein